MDVLGDMIARGWQHFVERPSGAMSLRFFMQPVLAAILAVRAGVSDARAGRPPYLLSVLQAARGQRWPLLKDALTHLRTPLVLGSLLDAIYQTITHRAIYLFELVFTVVLLAVIPYILVRGPVTRIARAHRAEPGAR